ncbi:membrane protein involved in aromatic hydrocarbon degradation [Sphingobium chlorophenolicum L-1]|uniref:Membrane protein involved in aromatic hydrocarbon degradation n=1 Tax=Sphingobium chlorophenolicum L-1 TaxID=690566 RepID=F6F1S7_SPHCR|nr:outer membrane protein transport protein [Sphingobium chlorophenolicum]AEG51493.1 membrane protein involved in aromatic hydrocarbon degradation [Sphingobium chlorophenolicum L-1]
MRAFDIFAAGICLGSLGTAFPAQATDGYYLTGANARATGMGGVGIALPAGPEAATINPAGAAFVENGFEIGVRLLMLETRTSNLFVPGNNVAADQYQPIPDFGINYHLNDKVTLAVTSFGGGLGQSYSQPFLPGMGFSKERANFIQAGISPTVALKVRDNLSIGVGLGLVNEFFRARGVIVPTPQGPTQLPNHGWSQAFGVGGRFGVLWKPVPTLAVGATYMTKVRMSRLKGYDEDLLAGLGESIDMPSQIGAGISVKPNARLTLGFDFLRTYWSDVKAFSEQAGFGWRDNNIYKFGAAYDLLPGFTVRAGTSLARRHFGSDFLLANVNTPGTSSKSLTFGFTKRVGEKDEISFSADYELNGKVEGTGHAQGTVLRSRYGFAGVSFTHRL